MKKIYYILNEDSQVVDFTEEVSDFLYDEVDDDISIDAIKNALDFDKRDYFYKDYILTSVAKSEVNTDILELQKENKLLHEQVKVLTEQGEMRDELISEMAGVIYAE